MTPEVEEFMVEFRKLIRKAQHECEFAGLPATVNLMEVKGLVILQSFGLLPNDHTIVSWSCSHAKLKETFEQFLMKHGTVRDEPHFMAYFIESVGLKLDMANKS